MATEYCPWCGGTGKGPGTNVSENGNYYTTHPPCSNCGGRGFVTVSNNNNSSNNSFGGGAGNNNGCFTGSTNILTPTGRRRIDTIKKNDSVVSYDQRTKQLTSERVLGVLKHDQITIWEINLTNKRTIRTTKTHSFYINNSWLPTYKIKPGDKITTILSSDSIIEESVKSVKCINQQETVYNIIVEGYFSFFADGALAHSFTLLRDLRSCIWNLVTKIEPLHSKVKAPGNCIT